MNYLFIGQESCQKEKAIQNLKSKLLSKDTSNLDFNIYRIGTDEMRDVVSCANTLPFYGKFKIIVIKNIDKATSKEKDILLKYLKMPNKHTTLIIDYAGELKENKLYEKLIKLTKKMYFKKPVGREVDYFIKKEVSNLNKTISNDAMMLLKELVGENDIDKLKNELEKISLFVGKKIEISKKDVKDSVAKIAEEDIFRLVDAISSKNAERSFDIVSGLILRKVRPSEIIGLLAWYFRNISLKPLKNHNFNKEQLKENLKVLLSTDFAIKRGRIKPVLLLELAILKLCT